MTVRYLHLPAGSAPPETGERGLFKAVVLIEQVVDRDWQDKVSDWLVAAGCRYMMAWGRDCSSWDDSVDYASRERFAPSYEAPDDAHVMTTWHDDEPMGEVFWFAEHAAFDAYYELPVTLIIDIVAVERGADILDTYAKAIASEA